MLENVLGVRLLLWAGDPLPLPQPHLLSALRRAEVTNDSDSMDGFQLSFALTKNRLGRYDIIDTLAPGTRVWIGAVLGVVPQPLIDAVVERHDLTPSGTPGESTLTVTGTTITSLLGLSERNQPHPNQPDSVIVAKVLGQYPELGLVPAVTPTTDIPLELERTPQQNETDLSLIERLAGTNGFVFYTEPLTFGVNKAYWGPVLRTSLPQPRLTVGMGAHQNVSSLSFGFDSLAAVGAEGSVVDPILKLKIPLPAMPALRLPPLSARPAPVRRTTQLRTAANAGPALGLLASAAAATKAPEAVSGTGSVDTARYGSILRARGLVGLRGAGTDYDGYYYVRSVTHRISVGSYTQSFALSREGTSSLTPVVAP
ncbi:hypothetical protein [Kribbella sp. NPDC003557]|uniref:hypothetical protein n=1 Tax=Kribbella sp. NPDC003557 TaxID=3154449 RepID=UPI0033A9CC86